ncbi:Nudix family hydrolase [Aurantivibrio plasticivorans]
MTQWVHVAVGVVRNAEGNILLAKRPDQAHQGGLWEFPGGKVEAGEAVSEALIRELQEEIGITPTEYSPLIQIRHHYPDKSVLLDVWDVTSFEGIPHGKEGQPIEWVETNTLDITGDADYPLPAANAHIVCAIKLPTLVAITGEFGEVDEFSSRIENAARSGVGMIYFRAATQTAVDECYIDAAIQACRAFNIRLQVPFYIFKQLTDDQLSSVSGVHLSSKELRLFKESNALAHYLVGASCHNAEEMNLASEAGVDYMLLSPVKPTQTHQDAAPLGWNLFEELVKNTNTPVYALGGLDASDVKLAIRCGARGVAGIRGFWK